MKAMVYFCIIYIICLWSEKRLTRDIPTRPTIWRSVIWKATNPALNLGKEPFYKSVVIIYLAQFLTKFTFWIIIHVSEIIRWNIFNFTLLQRSPRLDSTRRIEGCEGSPPGVEWGVLQGRLQELRLGCSTPVAGLENA